MMMMMMMAVGNTTHRVVDNAVGVIDQHCVIVDVTSSAHLVLSDLPTRWRVHIDHLRLWGHAILVLRLLQLLIDDRWSTKLI